MRTRARLAAAELGLNRASTRGGMKSEVKVEASIDDGIFEERWGR